MNIIPKKSKSNDLISNKKSYTASKKLWIFILDCLIELFSPQLSSKFPYKQQIAIEAIKDLIVTAQIVSISWYPSMPIHNWDSHSQFWRSLLILNYDNLCNYFGLYSICYVIEFSLLFYAIFVTILCCILKYFCRSLPLIFLHIAKKIINALTSILFIPFLLIPIVVFKYSTFHNNQVQEYSANDISKYDYGSYGTVLSPFVLIILIMMAFINELFTADLKHSESDINIRARSNSLWDLLWILLCIIQCLLYVFMDTHLYIHYLIISLVMNLYLFYLGLKFLHYYKPTGMLIKICKVGTICIVKLFFMLGYAMDDPASLPLLSIFISPLFSIYMIYFVNKKYSKLKRITNCPLNQFAFERAFRHYLIDSKCNNKEEIIRAFCQCSIQNGFKYNALFVIWEVNFISHIVKNQRLARVKLVKTAYLPSNAEGVIQKQKLLKYLEDELSRKWPEIDHLEYLTNCEEVKKLDEEFCIILMDFWAEIIDKTSKISRICNFTNRIFDLSCKIKALYLSLIHKNKHSEVLDLYGMFLINILGENDEGNLILQRKQSIKKIKSGMGDFGKPLEVTEHTGFILISTEPDSFGAISYMNEEAASTLKVSSLDIVGADFGIFIPKPFSLIHKDKMKEFYLNCKTTSIHKPQPLPFLDSTGHIIECMNSIRIVAFNDKAYYMVSFSKFKSSRQSILISEDGFIYSHTAKLSTWIESKISDFQDMHISELSFGIDLRKLKTFEPAIIQLKHKRIALVFIVKTIKETKINNILVLRDQNEIKQWLNKNCEEKNGFCDYDMPSIIEGIEAFATDQNAQLDYFEEKNIMDNSHEESSFDKKYLYQANISSFSQSSTTDRKLYIENANRFINGTIAAIKDFKWILLFTVISMVGTNIGILIYMVDDITHTDSLETFHHLGQIMIYISSISGLSRSIDLGLTRGIAGLAKNLEYLENNVKALSDLKTTILDDKSRWNYCVSSDIVVKNIIPVWEFERDDFKLQKYNLYDTVSLFIEHVIFIQEKGLLEDARQKDIDYRNHLKWLMINSLSFSYHYIENALSDLVDCETNRVEETSIRINSLLMLGIFILMICLGILLYFIAFLKVHYEKFWNFIKKTVVANYLFIRQASLDRLVSVHGSDLGQDYSFTQKPAATKNFYIKTTLSWKFIWRLSFLGVVSLSFYLLILLYFYKDCEIYMINRPKLLQTLNIRRSLLSQIGFYARDAYRPIAIGYYPNSYSFANSSSEFPSLISYYKTHSYALCESNFKSLISHKLGKNFYESAKYSEYVLDFGIRAAINIFHFDSYYIGNSAFISGKEYSDYISHFMVLQDALADAFDMANTSSKQVISGQLNLIIWVTAIFSAGLVLLYLAYFLPFFEKQTYFLRKMKILPKMILMSEKDFKTKF